METQVLIVSNFSPNSQGHGGERRSYQIKQLLQGKYNLVYFKTGPNKDFKISKLIVGFLLFVKILLCFFRKAIFYRTSWFTIVSVALKIQQHLHENQNIKTLIWESTTPNFWYIPYLCKSLFGLRVIALPHNLESFVSYNSTSKSADQKITLLQSEISYLKECDFVFTISYEEYWLLKNIDIQCSALPYFPTGEIEQQIHLIRSNRKSRILGSGKQFLILGTVLNPPTYKGMVELIEELKKEEYKQLNAEFIVAGFGSESLSEFTNEPHIKLKGSLSESELFELLSSIDAAIIHQSSSSGALTKMVEFNYMSIPIICNTDSARSIQYLNGINIYQSFDQLLNLLSQQEYVAIQSTLNTQMYVNQFLEKVSA
jgi:glycosyltransferase involved in cell wall biosynthesis